MSVWNPTREELMAAAVFVLSDTPPLFSVSDALFIHGSIGDEALDKRELNEAARLYHEKAVRRIALNGVTKESCRRNNLAYVGYQKWLKYLVSNRGVPRDHILLLNSSYHTADESETLVRCAAQKGWRTVMIMSYPHHQLRCFLQIIAAMRRNGTAFRVYNHSFRLSDSDWTRPITKKVMSGGGGDVSGTFAVQVASEFERIVKYAADDPSGAFQPHAAIPEMFEYVRERESL